MSKKNFLNSILQQTSLPRGFWGRLMLRGMNRFHRPLARWCLSQVDWQPAWSVADVGCGGGAVVAALLRLCPGGHVTGVDVSAESVAFARRRNRALLGSRCTIEQADVARLPLDAAAVDAVTALETIYFWPDLSAAFREVARVLRPGGVFLIGCEASDPLRSRVWTDRIEGMTVYTPEALRPLLEQAGFVDVTVARRGECVCLTSSRSGGKEARP